MQEFKKTMGVMAFIIAFVSLFIILPLSLQARELQNVLIIGWDGCPRDTVRNMLAAKELPNLSALIKDGHMVDIDVTTGATDTKAGWAQILTGYSPDITGVYSNGRYQPIPEGMTILERVDKTLGDDRVFTALIAGKSVNIDRDAPRKVPYEWWMRHSETNGILDFFSPKRRIEKIGASIVEEDGQKYVAIPGKVYYLTQKGIDAFSNGLGDTEKTARYAIDTIIKHRHSRFLITVIFPEPDNSGHKYGEGSKEYKKGIKVCDQWTGAVLAKLKELGVYDRTLIYIVSDHGFDAGHRTHDKASHVFCATNDKQINRNGDRVDIAPTVLKRLGVDPARMIPAFPGKALDEPVAHIKH